VCVCVNVGGSLEIQDDEHDDGDTARRCECGIAERMNGILN
jgi:hypothetical protein